MTTPIRHAQPCKEIHERVEQRYHPFLAEIDENDVGFWCVAPESVEAPGKALGERKDAHLPEFFDLLQYVVWFAEVDNASFFVPLCYLYVTFTRAVGG